MAVFEDLYLVVIAGGSGTRFWPKSTSQRPKQLLSFGGERTPSLLAQTIDRFQGWVLQNQKYIVTTRHLEDAVIKENLSVEVLAEPQGRNTSPCIYWAAREIAKRNPTGIMMVMPADHHILKVDKFVSVVKAAAEWARKNEDLVTLGICPSRPETGYGYLKTSSINPASGSLVEVKKVDAFVEKPNAEKAEKFFQSGNYLWNAGMFLWRVDVVLKAFDQWMPEMKRAWDQSGGKIEDAYPQMTATSIDYGIMEKAKNVVTFPLECGWDDLGSWTSLESLADLCGTKKGTNTVTAGEFVGIDSDRNIVDVPTKLVALLGVEDLIVVESGGSLLVAHKTRAQDIRKVVEEVKKVRPEFV